MNEFRITRLNHHDQSVAARLKPLHDAAYQLEAALIQAEDFPPLRRTVDDYATADTVFYGCVDGDEVLGAIEVESCADGRIGIAGLVVDVHHFRRGIGARLVEFVLNEYESKEIEVTTATGNEPALALYRRFGFEPVEYWDSPEGFSLVRLDRNR